MLRTNSVVTPAAGIKKRNLDPLSVNARDVKYRAVSQTENFYLGSRGLEMSERNVVSEYKHSIVAGEASHLASDRVVDLSEIAIDIETTKYAEINTDRRIAIKYAYLSIYGLQPENLKHYNGVNSFCTVY
jgi:hypothetical protein